jgi:glycine oxidase
LIDGRVSEVIARNGAVESVSTEGGASFLADAVVVAAGVAVSKIAMPLPAPPIHPVKGEALAVKFANGGPQCVVRAPGAYLCPKTEGRVVIGATSLPHDATREPAPAAIEALRAAARRAIPSVADCPEMERWAGLRPATPDGAPIIGRDARGPENLYFAVGHYRNGVLLAPETAELLAPVVLKGAASRALRSFRPERPFEPLSTFRRN